ncbi:MAG: 3alpha(or 20beta)-hydroxysteroid dehydrogenase [Pseudonocardiales bacterium]|nr:3alpha(or 20beta)-hydroxysteroid dehydrogenase [Pseudonocardiales bacterium]
MTGRLDGKVAIVTGAARGIGEGTVRRFAEEGARVVITDVLEEEGRAVAADLGDVAMFHRHDVTQEGDWQAVVAAATGQFGGVDVLINNAGIFRKAALEVQTVEGFDQVVAVNLRGVFLGMKTVAAPMRARGGGSIVNTSSTSGLTGLATQVAYGASKWGVRGITKVAAIELGEDKIRVNSIHPGTVDTPMTMGGSNRGNNPLRRIGLPVDIANVHLFLASDESSWITGAEINIDGGSVAGRVLGEPTNAAHNAGKS